MPLKCNYIYCKCEPWEEAVPGRDALPEPVTWKTKASAHNCFYVLNFYSVYCYGLFLLSVSLVRGIRKNYVTPKESKNHTVHLES